MIGDSLTTAVLQRALDGTWQQEKSTAANLANHETPGYRAIKVDFENALKNAVQNMHKSVTVSGGSYMSALDQVKNADISARQSRIYVERADASNVNLEEENIEMAKVQIQYSYLTRQMTDTFSRLRYAIRGGN
jgi:flagellar basal-body rod protein FlgB